MRRTFAASHAWVTNERRGGVVVSTPAWHAGDLGSIPGRGMLNFRFKNLALNIGHCVSLCLLEETPKAVGPFYLVSMSGEVKDPTRGKCLTCHGLYILA